MDPDSAFEFVQQLGRDLQDGYHVVPFIGAGFSLGAGYPTTTVLAQHLLPYWIIRGLGLNPFAVGLPEGETRKAEALAPKLRQWSPTDGWWPSAGEELLASEEKNQRPFSAGDALKLLEAICPEGKPPPSDAELPMTLDTLDRARTVLKSGDWMSRLQFLSRLSRPSTEQLQITSGPERQSVVDSLFLHLNKQCQPALAHEMLAALQNLWRCRVILTTNFDTLIENAFTNAREPLETFEVGKTSPLPDANLVLAQPSLVKLHGGRFDVRADVTVGSPLGREDIKNAMSYVAGRDLFRSDKLQPPAAANDKVVLIFIGCGDEDQRTISFAQYVSQHFKNFSKVYWVSYTEKKLDDIKTIRGFAARKFTVNYSDFGLLLLSLYEHLAGSIPANGAINPGPWQLASPPRIPKNDDANVMPMLTLARCRLREKLFIVNGQDRLTKEEIEGTKAPRDFDTLRWSNLELENKHLTWLQLTEDNYAAAAICLAFFEKARPYNFKSLWLDLDEITMPAGVFIRIVMMLHRMEGVIDPLTTLGVEGFDSPQNFESYSTTVMDALTRHHAQTGVPVVVFLNASEPPGTEALFRLPSEESTERTKERNRWCGKRGTEEIEMLFDIMEKLTANISCGMKFVIAAPLERIEDNQPDAEAFDKVLKKRAASKGSDKRIEVLNISSPCTAFHPEKATELAIQWIHTGTCSAPDDVVATARATCAQAPVTPSREGLTLDNDFAIELRKIFMAVTVKFRQSRYPSALGRIVYSYFQERAHEGMPKTLTEKEIQTQVLQWLTLLERNRVIRRRDGGFVWMNNRVQRSLRKELAKEEGIDCQTVHACIARWHARLLFSCSDPLSAKEGIHHHLQGIRWLLTHTDRAHSEGVNNAIAMLEHAQQLLNTSRFLFERRIATTFSDRSFRFLIEEVDGLIKFQGQFAHKPTPRGGRSHTHTNKDKRHPEMAKLFERLQSFRELLLSCRSVVALREGQFESLREMTWEEITHWEKSYKPPHMHMRLRHAAALLHRRCYEASTKEFEALWNISIKEITPEKSIADTGFLWRALDDACTPSPVLPNAEQTARALKSRIDDEAKAVILIRLARWGMYLHLNRSQASWVCASAPEANDFNISDESRLQAARTIRLGAMQRAKWFFMFGTELLRRCHNIFDGRVFDENILMRAHGALVLGILHCQATGRTTRAEDAWRLHGDADSFLGGFPVSDGGVTSAIVSLRAAELCLLEVTRDRGFNATRSALRQLTIPLVDDSEEALRPCSSQSIQNRIWNARTHSMSVALSPIQCENLAVKIGEGINWLDKAEAVLVKHPKSRWWWSIFAVLKTKACEYLHSLRLARALASNSGQGLEPRILLPSAFIFQDSGLLRLVVEKDISDLFYLSRVLSSLVEILRCERHYAVLYSNDDPPLRTYTRQRRNSIPLLKSRRRLIARLHKKLKTLYEGSHGGVAQGAANGSGRTVSKDVLTYARHTLEKAAKVLTQDEPKNLQA